MLSLVALLFATSFVPASDKIFPTDAVVDITRPPYSAKPDDNIDDTAAIQRAISDCVETQKPIYFPAGTYDLSDTLVAKNHAGLFRPMLTLQGQSRERTILRLKDNAPGFNDPAKPKAVLITGSLQEKGDVEDGGGNKAFANYVRDLTIDTGHGNGAAVAIDWTVSNWGAIEDVTLRSSDGGGAAGISAKRRIPGPGFIHRVEIEGFDHGIDVADGQYSLTLEDLTLRYQRVAGIRNHDNLLHVRNLRSQNSVPAIVTEGAINTLTLLDSRLDGTAAGTPALDLTGNFLVFNVAANPPAATRVNGSTDAPSPLTNWTIGPAGPVFWPAERFAKQAIVPEASPVFWNNDLTDWSAVGPRCEGEIDDTAAIQRAIDAGKRTVYFPIGRTYFISDTILVRGNVRQILGMGTGLSLGAAEKPFSDVDHPRPLFRILPMNGEDVTFEHMFFNAQYPGEVLFENDSPKTLIIRHGGGWVGKGKYKRTYQNTPRATGKVFVEDAFLPGWDFTNQTVFARQFNPENQEGDGVIPQVRNTGGKLWILGFKTEGQAPFIVTRDGGVTNLLGAYNYINATIPPAVPADAVPYVTENATSFLSFTTENFRDNDYRVYLRSTQNGVVKDWKREQMPPRNGAAGYRSFHMPLYNSADDPPAK